MSFFIAITGKGGVGKTTFSSILVKQLIANNCKPVLAVDADPNSCLDVALGVKVVKSVGTSREEVRDIASQNISSGVSKQEVLRMKISESLVEANGFDLISMGRPEGAGCYCYANNVLKSAIMELSSQYPYVVLDNEAGLENLSRRLVQKVDILVLVSDASNVGLETLARLHQLAVEMNIEYTKLVLVINRLRNGNLPEKAAEIQQRTGADFVIGLPNDAEIAEFAEDGRDFQNLSDTNPVVIEVNEFINKTIKN